VPSPELWPRSFGTVGRSGRDRPGKKMISKSLTRRVEHLECRSEPVGEAVGEPIIINMNFVDKDLKVVDHMQLTVAAPPNDAGWRARAWRRR